MLPRRREAELVVETLGDETLVYDRKRHKAHCLNATAALVWQHCDGRTTHAQLARVVERKLGLSEGEELVTFALNRLASANLLAESPREETAQKRYSRRDLVRKLGVAAVLVPAVMTVVAPTAAMAATSRPDGSPCTLSSQCESGCCCGNNSGTFKQRCAPRPFALSCPAIGGSPGCQ